MKMSFKITIECPDSEFASVPPREQVRSFLEREALFAGGCMFGGDEDTWPDWEFVLYRHATTKVT